MYGITLGPRAFISIFESSAIELLAISALAVGGLINLVYLTKLSRAARVQDPITARRAKKALAFVGIGAVAFLLAPDPPGLGLHWLDGVFALYLAACSIAHLRVFSSGLHRT